MADCNEFFKKIEKYFSISEIYYCSDDVLSRIQERNINKPLSYNAELEELTIHDYDIDKLLNILSAYKKRKFLFVQPYSLCRVIASKECKFIMSINYFDVTSSEHVKINIPSTKMLLEELKQSEQNILMDVFEENENTLLLVKGSNISKNTFVRNVFETLDKHGLLPMYSELWYIKTKDKSIDSIFLLRSLFDKKLTQREQYSIKQDFERYLHHYIKPLSIFDIIGPSMIGPSSSHTAGANRIGNISRNILTALSKDLDLDISGIKVKLMGSFRDTGLGHKTPLAIGGGLCGYSSDHPEMLKYGEPGYLKKNGICINGKIVPFLGFEKGSILEEEKYGKDHCKNIAEIIAYTNKGIYTITGFSIGGGNVEIRYFNGKTVGPITGKELFYMVDGEIVTETEARKHLYPILIEPIIKSKNSFNKKYKLPFNTLEEFEHYILQNELNIIDVIIDVERNLQGKERDEIYQQANYYWDIMKSAVKKGLEDTTKTILNLSGDDSSKIKTFFEDNSIFNNLYSRAVAYAIAVSEVNAKSGVVVACPTAGSCGILPGVLNAYYETKKADETKILEAIILSGFLGMILFNDVTTAGADYGCQAEIGVGAAMAAAALTYVEGGNITQIIHAFTLAIKNSLGLICDPIAGLVEIPCVKRNGIYASLAISCALLALSGVKSFVSPDEVVITMKEVGDKLHSDYKETAAGGLAKTRDGKMIEKMFEKLNENFFEN